MVLKIRKSIWLVAVAGGLAAGFLLAFERFFAPPPPAWVLMAGRGAVDPGAGGVGIFFHAIWKAGGEAGLGWLAWGADFVVSAVMAGGVLVLAGWLAGRSGRYRWLVWVSAILIVGGWAVTTLVFSSIRWREDRLRAEWPWDLVREAAGARAYYSPTALFLAGLEGGSGDLAESMRLARDPVEWRKAARQAGWSAVVLAGPPSGYRELLDHIVESPDWRLAAIRPGGYLYLRDGRLPVALPDLENWDAGSPLATARSLARLSEKFEAIRDVAAARRAIMGAMEIAPRDIEVLLHAAHFAAARERWHDVKEHAEDALKARPGHAHAWYLLALAAMESGDLGAAREAAGHAVAGSREPAAVLLKARICRAQRDFVAEAETLRGLPALYPEASVPRVEAWIFLGQARAAAGQASLAIEAYRQALDSGVLPAEQRADVEESIRTIQKNSGLE